MNVFKFAALAVVSVAACAFAQQMHFGAHVGVGYNSFWNAELNLPNSSDEGTYYRDEASISGLEEASGIGFSFGGAMIYKMGPSFALQPELLFSYRNRSTDMKMTITQYERDSRNDPWKYEGSDSEILPDVSITQWYIDIPVLARINLGPSMFLLAGPEFSIELSADGEAMIVSMDVSDYTTSFVVGLQVGLGYSIALGGGSQLDIDARFNLGLTSIISDEILIPGERMKIDGTTFADPKDFNIYLGATYWFI